MPQPKSIGFITKGVQDLVMEKEELLKKVLDVFAKEVHRCEDYFYVLDVDGKRFFAADNGEDGYTLMLPEEY